jgi:saccharopine dehydrogenase-like NADP-dependent oxidoreductase
MQKTAIQQAIEIVQNRSIDLSIVDDADNPHARYAVKEHEATIAVLKGLLPTEQEQIEQAYKQGCAYINTSFTKEHWDIDANIYYNETYKTEQ